MGQISAFMGNGRMLIGMTAADRSLVFYGPPLYGIEYARLEVEAADVRCVRVHDDGSGLFSCGARILSDNGMLELARLYDVLDWSAPFFLRCIDARCDMKYVLKLSDGVRLYDFPAQSAGGITLRKLVLVMSADKLGSAYDNGAVSIAMFGGCSFDPIGCAVSFGAGRSFIAVSCGQPDECEKLLSDAVRKLGRCDFNAERCEFSRNARTADAALRADIAYGNSAASDAAAMICALQSHSGAVISPDAPLSADVLTQCAAVWMFCECGLFSRARAVLDFLASRALGGGLLYAEPAGIYGKGIGAFHGGSVVGTAVILAAALYIRMSGDCGAAEDFREMLGYESARSTDALVRCTLPWCGREAVFDAGVQVDLADTASAVSTVLYIAAMNEYLALYGKNERYETALRRVCGNFRCNFALRGKFRASNPAILVPGGKSRFGRCLVCGCDEWLAYTSGVGYLCLGCLSERRDRPLRRCETVYAEVPAMPDAFLYPRIFGIGDMCGLAGYELPGIREAADMHGMHGMYSPCCDALALYAADEVDAELIYDRLCGVCRDGRWYEYERYGEACGDFVRASAVCAAATTVYMRRKCEKFR